MKVLVIGKGGREEPTAASVIPRIDPERARAVLTDLVALRAEGLREPLPLFAKTSERYVADRPRKTSRRGRHATPRRWTVEDLRRQFLGFALQSGELLTNLTVFENVEMPLRLNGRSAAEADVTAADKELAGWKRDLDGAYEALVVRRQWAQARVDAADRVSPH